LSKRLCLVVAFVFSCPLFAQLSPVPVENEPLHHVLFQNDSVLVVRLTLQPGATTQFHTHSHDRVIVDLTDGSITEQVPGGPESTPQSTKPGQLSVSSLARNGPYTHRVHNVGSSVFDVLDIEFLQPPRESESKPIAPVAIENPSARVYKWRLEPGTTSAMHTHERPYLIISATPLVLKMTDPEGKSFSHEVKAGDIHWVDDKVTHSLSNAGTTEGQIVEVELK
jgi:beta-alanine degradation protein BauB